MDLGTAWERVDRRFRLSLAQASSSLGRRDLPVGAVVASDNEVLSQGRNRVYDPPGGPDPLQGTQLAHAEMNALALLGHDIDFARCSLGSTHAPCAMCAAAIEYAGLASTHYLANDPSADRLAPPGPTAESDASLWTVVANVMFLHNIAWVGGRDNPIAARNARFEPEIASLALRVLGDQSFIRASNSGGDLLTGLATTWRSVVEVSDSRLARG